ncbi:uncharacterized protein lcp2b [Aplochiton taeniatus]
MNSEGFPTKAEVLRWDSGALADYMKKLKLSGCDKVVMKGSMNGARFLDDSDDDYEQPEEQGEMEDSYVCALDEDDPRLGEDDDYEPPPCKAEEAPRMLNLGKPLASSVYIVFAPCPSSQNGAVQSEAFKTRRKRLIGQRNRDRLDPTDLSQEMDFRWYAGMVTRRQAEASLRGVDKDGAFLVRDSSKRLSAQPYTLMVLSQGKVYNIQIRQQNGSYTLGTNRSESFPAVTDIIGFHTHTPLLLIDALDRSPEAQSQCYLAHPAGS